MEALKSVEELCKDFQEFDVNDENSLKVESFMGELPEKYEVDYSVYAASNSITEEPIIWEMDYVEVYRRMMFKKFDGWIQNKMMSNNGE